MLFKVLFWLIPEELTDWPFSWMNNTTQPDEDRGRICFQEHHGGQWDMRQLPTEACAWIQA